MGIVCAVVVVCGEAPWREVGYRGQGTGDTRVIMLIIIILCSSETGMNADPKWR